jgi:hypothetical protein
VVTRVEKWGLLFAVAILIALGLALGVSLFPSSVTPWAESADGPGNPSLVYSANQPVQAWHDDRWYPARIHSASNDRYFITYDNFSTSWHEWVTARRLRAR